MKNILPELKKTLIKLSSDVDIWIVVIYILFLLGLLLVSSVKIFFIISYLFFGLLVVASSFDRAVIYVLPAYLFFNHGQSYSFLLIPEKAIMSSQYWAGRHGGFVFSPFIVVFLVAIIIKFFRSANFVTLQRKAMLSDLFLMGLISMSIVMAIYQAPMPMFSLLSICPQLLLLAWAWYLLDLGQSHSQSVWKKTLTTLMSVFGLYIFYEFFVVIAQFITSGPIGLFIEATQASPVFGLGSDEMGGIFRPFGLSAHPNGLANKQLLLVATILFLSTYVKLNVVKKLTWQKILMIVLSLSTSMVVFSLSRAAWIALALGALFIHIRHQKILKKVKQIINQLWHGLRPWGQLFLIILFVSTSVLVSTRLIYSTFSFQEFGGFGTRLEQYHEAWQLFKMNPIFGVGYNMFIRASYLQFPNGVMSYFSENVHNGFLLFLVEYGTLGTLFYSLFLGSLLWKVKNLDLRRINKSMIYLGLIFSFTMMIFHPERNLLNYYIILLLSIVRYENYKNTIQSNF